MAKQMTKKEFKEQCNFRRYGTRNTDKLNAIYFGWGGTVDTGIGYKYVVKGYTNDLSKAELTNVLYDWVFNEVQPPWYVQYKYAENDSKRFKVKISEGCRYKSTSNR